MDNGNIAGACVVTGLWVFLSEYNVHVRCDLFAYNDVYVIIANKEEFMHHGGILTDFTMHETFRVGDTVMAHASLCDAVSMRVQDMIEQYMPELFSITGFEGSDD